MQDARSKHDDKVIRCHAAHAPKATLEMFQYEPKELGPDDVEIQITHCGICHSDVHLIDNDWGLSVYPLVPGHEIIGKVVAVGSSVKHLAAGARIGVGWQRSACLECDWCLSGDDNLCPQNQATCVGNHGGFAERMRTDSRFAFPIPESLASENAAPLLCGGITVYSPLCHHGVGSRTKAGVVGIGGLGHLALQFARALGAEVTAFSTSPAKEKEARGFGAERFVVSSDAAQMQAAAGSLDFILSTVSADVDWPAYVNILRPKGTLCIVGVPPSPVSVPAFPLIAYQKSVTGSPIGSRHRIREMLEFAAKHRIQAKTEVFPMADVNLAIDRLRKNQARYRLVLKN